MSKSALVALFGFILLSLAMFTSFASTQQPVWEWSGLTARPNNWWTIATLMDAYYGFLTFYVWVFYKETRGWPRAAWLAAILLLGNMAMSAYVLRQLWRLRPGETMGDLLATRNP